jgi:hypothetical protein
MCIQIMQHSRHTVANQCSCCKRINCTTGTTLIQQFEQGKANCWPVPAHAVRLEFALISLCKQRGRPFLVMLLSTAATADCASLTECTSETDTGAANCCWCCMASALLLLRFLQVAPGWKNT